MSVTNIELRWHISVNELLEWTNKNSKNSDLNEVASTSGI